MTGAPNREAWLHHAAEAMTPWLEELEGVKVPELRISVGWPSHGGLGKSRLVVGECWPSSCSADKASQIFISPVRDAEDTLDVLTTLIHEMIHAADDCKSGHKGNFVRIARFVGLVPKWTESNAGEELAERMRGLIERLGPIPHVKIKTKVRAADAPKKQGTRMLKLQCPECEYTARTTQKWIDVGLPTCCCGSQMEEA